MEKRKAIKTTKKQIVDYWMEHADEGGLSVDFSEAEQRCWRCGCERGLERCHIVRPLEAEKIRLLILFCCVNAAIWIIQM